MDVILGVDGGGTKTIAVTSTLEGRIIKIGYSGPSNQNIIGLKNAYLNIIDAVQKAMPKSRTNVLVACFGLAGIDNKENYSSMLDKLKKSRISDKIILISDVEIALSSGTWGEHGIVIVAGTGSNVYGRNALGLHTRAGDWGYIIGDEGGAYYISRLALNAVFREYDGRGPSTLLTEIIKNYFNVENLPDIIPIIYKHMSITEIANIAKLVIEAAKKGDYVAKSILKLGGKELGLAAVAVIKKLGMENEKFKVVFVGGMFNAGMYFIRPIKREIKRIAPKAIFIKPNVPPVMGALALSLKHVRGDIDDDLKRKLIKSWNLRKRLNNKFIQEVNIK
jgi:N-acetylglucosamine kinase-like BadF-type ATPase